MNTQSRIGKWSIIFGIVIVLNLFFNYALSLVYKSPDYLAYCPQTQVVTQPTDQKSCTDKGGQWNANTYYGKPLVPGETVPPGYCDLEFTCRQDFQKANDTYSRNVFVILVVLGAISVALGNFFAGNAVIASGLSLAGVLSFIIASTRYWGSANDAIRVVILLIALSLLFWVAVKKFKNNG
jgi:hypothetical protein